MIKDVMNNSSEIFDVIEPDIAYIYKLSNISKNEPVLKENSHVLLTATDEVTNEWTGQKIEVILSTTDGERIPTSTSTSVLNKSLQRARFIDIFTVDHKYNDLSENVYVMTIKEPLDIQKHYNGEQTVLILKEIKPQETFPPDVTGILNAKTGTMITARTIADSTEQFLNCEVQFNFDPNVGKDIDRLLIDLQKQTLLNSIQVKSTQQNGLTVDVPIKTTNQLVPIFANVVEDQEKLTMYFPAFNHDFTIPFVYAKLFSQAATLSKTISGKPEQEAILDMILYTYAFADEFSFVEYITSGKDAGKIQGDQYIGYTPKQASQLTGKDPKMIISNIFEKYLRRYPKSEVSTEIRILNQHIAALSRWITSTKAIKGGNNSFNKVFLPFTLRVFEGIVPEKIDIPDSTIPGKTGIRSWVLQESKMKFVLESLYFAIGQGTIFNSKEVNLSQVKQLQADVKFNLPILPERVQKQNVASRPNEISEKDVQYIFYAPVDNSKLGDFFGEKEIIQVGVDPGTEITINATTFSSFGKHYENTQEDKKKLFEDLGYQGDYISATLEEIKEKRVLNYDQTVETLGSFPSFYKEATSVTGDLIGAVVDPNRGPAQLYLSKPLYDKAKVIAALGVDSSTITNFKTNSVGDYDATASYDISHFRLANLRFVARSGSSIQESLLDRVNQFDKFGWKKQIDAFSSTPSSTNIKYSLEVTPVETINRLKEISIHSLFSEETTLHLGGKTITFRNFNKEDETIGIERYIIR